MQIRVMSFNLRYDKPDPGQQNWQARKTAIAELIQHYNPDLIGTQEGKPHQIADLKYLLSTYHTIGGDRTGSGQDEFCTIFFQANLYCEYTQDFFLSESPETPGSITPSWGNRLPRMATWGRFSLPDCPEKIILLNTHLDHESANARTLGATLIHQRLAQFPPEHYLLVTGDFNTQAQSKARQILRSPLGNGQHLQDAIASLPAHQQMTLHNFTGRGCDAIDTIYCDRRLKINQVKIDRQRWQGIWPSDHFPVIAILEHAEASGSS